MNGGDADWVVASRRTEVIRPFLKAGWLPSRQADYIAVSLTIGPIVRRIGSRILELHAAKVRYEEIRSISCRPTSPTSRP